MQRLDLIYKDQKAMIVMSGYNTKQINIYQGVRHGCPMSPLIFDLALESLAVAIRVNQEIEGVKIGWET